MKLSIIAIFSTFLFADECAAQFTRLRKKSLYKSAGSQRKLQVGTENIFDVPVDPTLVTVDPTEVPVVTLSISLSLPPFLPPPILSIQSTVAPTTTAPVSSSEPNMDVELSMSAPEEPVFSITTPQTTALPQVSVPSEFGVPDEIASVPMSLPAIDVTTVVATTMPPSMPAVTTVPPATTVEATTVLPTTVAMSMPEVTAPTEPSPPSGGDVSMPYVSPSSLPPQDFIPPIDESVAPTKMPTTWFENAADSSKSSAYSMGEYCAVTIAAVAAGLHMMF